MNLWEKLITQFTLIPAGWGITAGDDTDGPYQHSTSVLGLSFCPDDDIIAIAGGGCLPGADGSLRLIQVETLKNILTLHAHTHGVHDVSFDPETGLLASASFGYTVNLWNLEVGDVIQLLDDNGRTKGYSRFSPKGSLLAVGEYLYYDDVHSFYIYDLNQQRAVFTHVLDEMMGVTAMNFSSNSAYLAVAAQQRDTTQPVRLYIVQLNNNNIIYEYQYSGLDMTHFVFIGDSHTRLLCSVILSDMNNTKSGIIEIDVCTGKIVWSHYSEEIAGPVASHPAINEVSVAIKPHGIRFYSHNDWTPLRECNCPTSQDHSSVCSLAYSNNGQLLAYGLSSGEFGIIRKS